MAESSRLTAQSSQPIARVLFASWYTGLGGGETDLLSLAHDLDPARYEPHLLLPHEGKLAVGSFGLNAAIAASISSCLTTKPLAAPEPAPEEKSRSGGFFEKVKKAIMPGSVDDAAGGEKAEASRRTPEYLTGAEAIKWLARTQNVDGSWYGDIEMTAAALIAFVRAGHTTRAGSYRRHVAKAMQYLQIKVLGAKGFAFYASLKALSELQRFSGDGELGDLGTIKLPPLQSEAERAARGDPNVVAPDSIHSLDDLRLVALVRGTAGERLDFDISSVSNELLQIWMAVGAPRTS